MSSIATGLAKSAQGAVTKVKYTAQDGALYLLAFPSAFLTESGADFFTQVDPSLFGGLAAAALLGAKQTAFSLGAKGRGRRLNVKNTLDYALLIEGDHPELAQRLRYKANAYKLQNCTLADLKEVQKDVQSEIDQAVSAASKQNHGLAS